MAKQVPQLNVLGKVLKSTSKFAQALLDAGVKVTEVCKNDAGLDCLFIKGRKRFSVAVVVNYEAGTLHACITTRNHHIQSAATCKTHNEFRTLLKVWGIAEYAS